MYLLLKTALFSNTLLLGFGRFNFNSTIPPEECQTKARLPGLIFPDVSNPFFGELVSKIEDRLFKHGYKAILCNAGNDKEKERTYLQMLMANQVDGIIAGAHNLGIEEYQRTGLPIVSFDRKLSDNIPIVRQQPKIRALK